METVYYTDRKPLPPNNFLVFPHLVMGVWIDKAVLEDYSNNISSVLKRLVLRPRPLKIVVKVWHKTNTSVLKLPEFETFKAFTNRSSWESGFFGEAFQGCRCRYYPLNRESWGLITAKDYALVIEASSAYKKYGEETFQEDLHFNGLHHELLQVVPISDKNFAPAETHLCVVGKALRALYKRNCEYDKWKSVLYRGDPIRCLPKLQKLLKDSLL